MPFSLEMNCEKLVKTTPIVMKLIDKSRESFHNLHRQLEQTRHREGDRPNHPSVILPI